MNDTSSALFWGTVAGGSYMVYQKALKNAIQMQNNLSTFPSLSQRVKSPSFSQSPDLSIFEKNPLSFASGSSVSSLKTERIGTLAQLKKTLAAFSSPEELRRMGLGDFSLIDEKHSSKFLSAIGNAFTAANIVRQGNVPVALDVFLSGAKESVLIPLTHQRATLTKPTGAALIDTSKVVQHVTKLRNGLYQSGGLYSAVSVLDPRVLQATKFSQKLDLERMNPTEFMLSQFGREDIVQAIQSGKISPKEFSKEFYKSNIIDPVTDFKGSEPIGRGLREINRSAQSQLSRVYLSGENESLSIKNLTQTELRKFSQLYASNLTFAGADPLKGRVVLDKERARMESMFPGAEMDINTRQLLRSSSLSISKGVSPLLKYQERMSMGIPQGLREATGDVITPLYAKTMQIPSEKLSGLLKHKFKNSFKLADEEMFIAQELARSSSIMLPDKTYTIASNHINKRLSGLLQGLSSLPNFEQLITTQGIQPLLGEANRKDLLFKRGEKLGLSNLEVGGRQSVERIDKSSRLQRLSNIKYEDGVFKLTFERISSLAQGVTKVFGTGKLRLDPTFKQRELQEIALAHLTGQDVTSFRKLKTNQFMDLVAKYNLEELAGISPISPLKGITSQSGDFLQALGRMKSTLKPSDYRSILTVVANKAFELQPSRIEEFQKLLRDPQKNITDKLNVLAKGLKTEDFTTFTHSFYAGDPDSYLSGNMARTSKSWFAALLYGKGKKEIAQDIISRTPGGLASNIYQRINIAMQANSPFKEVKSILASEIQNFSQEHLRSLAESKGTTLFNLGKSIPLKDQGGKVIGSLSHIPLPIDLDKYDTELLESGREIKSRLVKEFENIHNLVSANTNIDSMSDAVSKHINLYKNIATSESSAIPGSMNLTISSEVGDSPLAQYISEQRYNEMLKDLQKAGSVSEQEIQNLSEAFKKGEGAFGLSGRYPMTDPWRSAPVEFKSAEYYLGRESTKYTKHSVYMSDLLKSVLGGDADQDQAFAMLASTKDAIQSLKTQVAYTDSLIANMRGVKTADLKSFVEKEVSAGSDPSYAYMATLKERGYKYIKEMGANIPLDLEAFDLRERQGLELLLQKGGIGKAHSALEHVRASLFLGGVEGSSMVEAFNWTTIMEENIIKSKYFKGTTDEINKVLSGNYLLDKLRQSKASDKFELLKDLTKNLLGASNVEALKPDEKVFLDIMMQGAEIAGRSFKQFEGTEELEELITHSRKGENLSTEAFLNTAKNLENSKIAPYFLETDMQAAKEMVTDKFKDIPFHSTFAEYSKRFTQLPKMAKGALLTGLGASLAFINNITSPVSASEANYDRMKNMENYETPSLPNRIYSSLFPEGQTKFMSLTVDRANNMHSAIRSILNTPSDRTNIFISDNSRSLNFDLLERRLDE